MRCLFPFAALLLAAPLAAADPAPLHERIITLDTHLDTPAVLGRPGWRFTDLHSWADDLSQVDLPRMREGGLDGGFFVIYTAQGPLTPEGYAAARAHAWKRVGQIRAMVAAAPDALAFATSARDARRIVKQGKRFVYQSIENSYPLGPSVAGLADFYKAGVRMAGPVHNGDNQFADAASRGQRSHGGLSPLGREWVAEMNRLGMIIDASHSSDETFDQLLALSRAPIVLSHSGPKATGMNHPRNIDDERLKRLAAKGGVIFLNSVFIEPTDDSPERGALEDRKEAMETMPPEARLEVARAWAALDAQRPYTLATFDQFMAGMLHALKLVGPDHVGVGADWDGGGGVLGMPDISALPRITARLKTEGYSDKDVEKIWSGNLLRVMKQVERARGR